MSTLAAELQSELDALKAAGTYKRLNYLESPQGPRVRMEGRGEVIVLSSNNYLGLANEPSVVQAGVDALHEFGAGTASVRFICGTFTIHRDLELALGDKAGRRDAQRALAVGRVGAAPEVRDVVREVGEDLQQERNREAGERGVEPERGAGRERGTEAHGDARPSRGQRVRPGGEDPDADA